MSGSTTPRPTSFAGPHQVPQAAWIRKTAHFIAALLARWRTARAIARLAETSPHLLLDAGFSQRTPGAWRRGNIWIVLHDQQAIVGTASDRASRTNAAP